MEGRVFSGIWSICKVLRVWGCRVTSCLIVAFMRILRVFAALEGSLLSFLMRGSFS